MGTIRQISPEVAAMGGVMPRVLRELEQHRESPRLLLVISCSFAELMVGTLIEAHCKNGKQINDNSRDFSFSVRLTLLHEMGILNEAESVTLNWLRKLRNDAAHKPDFVFTKDRLPDWADQDHKEPEALFSLCVNLLGVFWNRHVTLFREKLPFELV